MSTRRAIGTQSTALRAIRAPPQFITTSTVRPFRRFLKSPTLRSEYKAHPRVRLQSTRLSSISYTAIGLALVVSFSGAYIGYRATRDSHPAEDLSKEQVSTIAADDYLAISLYGMAAAIPPGRPGNLTAEQEQKLREFWALVLRVFGVAGVEANGTHEQDVGASAPASIAEGSEKKEKKKRLGLFRKKEHDKEKDSKATKPVADTSGFEGIADADDKYGQNKEFKTAMASKTPEELRAALWAMAKHDHPDGLLLRFLRARKWEIHPALVMMISTMHWRAEDMKVDSDIVLRGEEGAIEDAPTSKDAADFMTQLKMGKSFLHGLDKEGRPLCIVRVRLHHGGEQTEKSLERFTVWTIETARMLLRPPVDTATIVFDMTSFSMANMDYTPVKFMIKCFEANYPESLGAVLVHKSPWIFQGIWKIIRGWLDPVVASKVHFTSNISELSEFIDMKQIPTELGGEENWDFSYVDPPANENAIMKDTATRDQLQSERTKLVEAFEAKTVEWVDGDTSEEVKRDRLKLAEQLRDNYWKLDPYIRARTIYDRTGYLKAPSSDPVSTLAKEASQPVANATSEADLD